MSPPCPLPLTRGRAVTAQAKEMSLSDIRLAGTSGHEYQRTRRVSSVGVDHAKDVVGCQAGIECQVLAGISLGQQVFKKDLGPAMVRACAWLGDGEFRYRLLTPSSSASACCVRPCSIRAAAMKRPRSAGAYPLLPMCADR